MPKPVTVIVFDFKGRRLGAYPTVRDCGMALGIHYSTIEKLLKNGKALKRNGMTFDIEEDD